MDEPILIATVVCPGCGATIDASAPGCQKCGSTGIPVFRPTPAARSAESVAISPARSIIDNRAYLLLLLFGASLVLGLPLLWYSRAYGVVGKLVVTLLLLVWTVVVLALFWWSLSWSIGRLRQIPW